MKTFKGT